MKNKILIIGAGSAGQELVPDLSSFYEIIGFLDDDKTKHGLKFKGLKILGGTDLLKKIVKAKKVEEVIIAMPSVEGEVIGKVVKLCVDAKVKFRIVPRVKEIIEGKAQLSTLRKVQVEDLLGRPIVKSDVEGLKKFFSKKRVLITGAAGSIGSELCRQICAYKPLEVSFVDWWENGMFELQMELKLLFPKLKLNFFIANITDKKRMTEVFAKTKPNFVYHAAAYKHVPLMEDNPSEAIKNNIFGTLNVANHAKDNGVERFVLVSTDKAANPKNIMGATKLITEGIGKMLNGKTKFMAVRFGNVLGSYGSVVPIFRKQIEEGGPITITDKRMTRFFMTIPEAAQLMLKAGSLWAGGGLFGLDIGKPVKIIDLAAPMIRLSGLIPEKDIKIVYTGVRKGEKINEKLFNRKEKKRMVRTSDEKIFITESIGFNLKKLPKSLEKLKKLSQMEDERGIRKEISLLVGKL